MKNPITEFSYRVLSPVLDLIYPRSCIGCQGPVEGKGFRYICPNCKRRLFRVEPPCCDTCGFPFFGKLEMGRTCPHCQGLNPVFEEGRTLILHRDLGSEIVRSLKYGKGFYLRHDIMEIMRLAEWLPYFLEGSYLVPVPLHKRKLRERGFNQSRFLADAFSDLVGNLPVVDALIRIKDTKSQTRLKRPDRMKNAKNAFAMSDDTHLDMKKDCIVVDDVFTTGATLNACCTELRKAGAERLRVLTLAHG